MLIADLALSRRLERAEAHANASFVESRVRLAPETGATWTDVDGAWAMYDGVGSPLTQSFGMGLYAPATNTQIERLTRFFDERGADSAHEVSPLADAAALPLLAAHGYRAIEWTTVLAQALTLRVLARAPRARSAFWSRSTAPRSPPEACPCTTVWPCSPGPAPSRAAVAVAHNVRCWRPACSSRGSTDATWP